MFFVGISGHIGCGKTTLAKNLVKGAMDNGGTAASFSLGSALKLEAAEVFGIGSYQATINESKKLPIEAICNTAGVCYAKALLGLDRKDTYRKLLQEYAQYRRKENPNYWVKAADIAIRNIINKNCEIIVIDDVRQPNEFHWIKETKKGIMIRIEDYPNYLSPTGGDHAVEHMLDNLDEFDFDHVYYPTYGGLEEISKSLLPHIYNAIMKAKQ